MGAGYGAVAGAEDDWIWTPLEHSALRVGVGAGSMGAVLGVGWRH